MVRGVGVDLLLVSRIEKICARNEQQFAKKILSCAELSDFDASNNKVDFLAKRFAVKEAVSKALGTGMSQGVSWNDMQLSHCELGQPLLSLSGVALQRLHALDAEGVHVSLSDDAGFVVAYAVIS